MIFDFRLCGSKSGSYDRKAIAGGFIDLEVSYHLALMSSQYYTYCLRTP